ncbi:hypothetical protein AMTRI_Chr11g156810 [Amborella trichopoda]
MEEGGAEERRHLTAGGEGRGHLSLSTSWPTVDGPLGLDEEDAVKYARNFFRAGFFLLPFLWFLNSFYFWPVLTRSSSFPRLRPYVLGSAIGFAVFMVLLCLWALTFAIGGERLFGPIWQHLVMYNVANTFGLTSWSQM